MTPYIFGKKVSIPVLLRLSRRKHPLQPGRPLVKVRVLPDAVVVLVRHARLVEIGLPCDLGRER